MALNKPRLSVHTQTQAPDSREGEQLCPALPWRTSLGIGKSIRPWLGILPRLTLSSRPAHCDLHCANILVSPFLVGGQRCCYTPLTTGKLCHHMLGAYSDHTFTCVQGPGVHRHNCLHDVWTRLCRQAGWHTDMEQLVYIAPGETKPADFVAHTTDGHRLECDVMVIAAPSPWDEHGTHLQRTSAAKATRYNTTHWGYMHDRAQLVPPRLLRHGARILPPLLFRLWPPSSIQPSWRHGSSMWPVAACSSKVGGRTSVHTVRTKIIADPEKCFRELISEKLLIFIAG